MFYIRTDGNKIIASGHIMRCLSIAKAIEQYGEEVTFITADTNAVELIESRGFSYISLETQWDDLDKELDIFIPFIKEKNINTLLVDSYQVTESYLKTLSQYTDIIYIDDRNAFLYPVHTIINYGINYKDFCYKEQYKNTNTKYLLGTDYVPLRQEFLHKKIDIKEKVERILVTTGGADLYNVAGLFVEEWYQEERKMDCEIWVISGKLNQNIQYLRKLEQTYKNLNIYENITTMSDIIMQCDLAISAGGTTLYELCACGIPTITFSVADNQIGAEEFEKQDILEYVGDIRKDIPIYIKKICDSVEQLSKDKTIREVRANHMKHLVDGKGAERIARYCLDNDKKEKDK